MDDLRIAIDAPRADDVAALAARHRACAAGSPRRRTSTCSPPVA